MRPTARALIVTGLALLGLLGFAGAPADDEPRLPPIVILDTQISGPHAIDDDLHPAVAWSRVTGEGLAVWTDGRNHASRGTDIYGRRVGANGKPIGDDFRISGLKATADERRPAVAWNQTSQQYLVVWEDGRNETARGVDIYGRYMETAGKPAGRDFRISGPSAVSEEIAPAVAWNEADNEFLVVWEDWRNSATRSTDIYGHRLGADGRPTASDFRISGSLAIGLEANASVAWSTADQYLVAWTDGRNYTARRHDVYVRRVSATGHPMGHDVGITGPGGTGFERLAAVVWNQATGKYLVVWEDERNLTVSGTSIFGRRVGTDGRSFGRHLNISGFTGMASARQPAVACNRTTGQCLVAWEDERNTATSGSDIYARRLNPDFGLEDFDTRVSGAGATGTEMSAAVAWSQSANRYLVVWSDGRNWASRDWDIYGRTLAG